MILELRYPGGVLVLDGASLGEVAGNKVFYSFDELKDAAGTAAASAEQPAGGKRQSRIPEDDSGVFIEGARHGSPHGRAPFSVIALRTEAADAPISCPRAGPAAGGGLDRPWYNEKKPNGQNPTIL